MNYLSLSRGLVYLCLTAFFSNVFAQSPGGYTILQCNGCGPDPASTQKLEKLLNTVPKDEPTAPKLEKVLNDWVYRQGSPQNVFIRIKKSGTPAEQYDWTHFSRAKSGFIKATVGTSGTMGSETCESWQCLLRDTLVVIDTLRFSMLPAGIQLAIRSFTGVYTPLTTDQAGTPMLAGSALAGWKAGVYLANVYFSAKEGSSSKRLGPLTLYLATDTDKQQLMELIRVYQAEPSWCDDLLAHLSAATRMAWGGSIMDLSVYKDSQKEVFLRLMRQAGVRCQFFHTTSGKRE